MRENRLSGSEGGEAETNRTSLPLSSCCYEAFPMDRLRGTIEFGTVRPSLRDLWLDIARSVSQQ